MQKREKLTIIDRDSTLKLVDLPGLIETAEQAFIAQSNNKGSAPAYINMQVGSHFAHYKAGYREGAQHFSVKYSGGFWANSEKGLPVDYGYVVVHDSATGKPELMFLDQGIITDYRTAAAGAVASKYAAKEHSFVVGVIGTGIQARLQVEALQYVRPKIKTVRIWGRNLSHAEKYVEEMKRKIPDVKYVICNLPEDAVSEVDVLITATPSKLPIVQSEWVSAGTHITAVGSCAPYMQEHEPEVLKRADFIYADSIEKCSQDGEIHHALDAGMITSENITGELGELIQGKIAKRTSEKQITFVDLVGLGIQDATAAEYLLNKYKESFL